MGGKGGEREGAKRGVRRRGRPGCRETQRREDYEEAREVCLGRLPIAVLRGQRRAAVTAVAPTSAPISSLSSLFLPLTVLQLSLLPSSLLTRTQPQAEVQMTPSAVAVAVARG